MDEKPKSKFEELAAINVGAKIEKKNGLSYLSWAWALDTLMRADPNAHWDYPEPKMYGETMMVYCTVTAFDKQRTAHLPVMDYRNKPIPNPDAFAVNTAMQRCLVKAIALHGLGLYIYAGEDLPYDESANDDGNAAAKAAPKKEAKGVISAPMEAWNSLTQEQQSRLIDLANVMQEACDVQDYAAAYELLERAGLEVEERAGLQTRFDSKTRTAMAKWRKENPQLKEAA